MDSRQTPLPLRVSDSPPQFESWAAVKIPTKLRSSIRLVIGIFFVCIVILAFVPWTQTIKAQGQLSAYSPVERPQEVHAPIEGRIQAWHVNEGMQVRKDDLLLELGDVDPKFLAPDLLARLDQSIQALNEKREAALTRAGLLDKQIEEMTKLTEAATRVVCRIFRQWVFSARGYTGLPFNVTRQNAQQFHVKGHLGFKDARSFT